MQSESRLPGLDRVAWQLAAALFVTAFLRIPSFRWPVISDDEAIYDAMAQVVNAGGVMYRDAIDHKPPGLVYLYAAIERWAGASGLGMYAVHALGIFVALATSIGLFLLARELLRRELWWLPPLLYGIASTAKCAYDGLAVNGELLMNLPVVFAVFALIKASRATPRARVGLDFGVGILLALSALVKWQALAVVAALPWFATVAMEKRATIRELLVRAVTWAAGAVIPFAVVIWFFSAHGVLAEAWRWGGLFNLRYISDGPGAFFALKRLGVQLAAVVIPSFVIYWAGAKGLLAGIREDGAMEARAWRGMAIWALVCFFAVGLGGRFFGHYFLQAELPLCLLAAEPLSRIFARAPRATATMVTVPVMAFFALNLAPQSTRAVFDPGEPDWTRVGQQVADRSSPEDTLFIWGNVPPLYHLSGRRMGTRFSFCNYLTGLSPGTPSEYDPSVSPSAAGASGAEAWAMLLSDLETRRPSLILDTAAAGWKGYGKFPIALYPELSGYIARHYRADSRISGAVLYRRID